MTSALDTFFVAKDANGAAAWKQKAGRLAGDWAPEIFAIPAANPQGAIDKTEVYGWTKGAFGVFEFIATTGIGELQATSLTHIKSGLKLATFASLDAGIIAAGAVSGLVDWNAVDSKATSDVVALGRRCYQAWQDAGLIMTFIYCADGRRLWALPKLDHGPLN